MRTKLFAGVAFAALLLPATAYAQSTGSVDFDDSGEIVVTGSGGDGSVGGIKVPDSPKAKVVVTSELIQRQRAGQSINDVLNLVPGVSFTNNDPWGSSGGSFSIRGFQSDRISQTFDGLPLNDSGNYALYTNQQVDGELIANVNVNLGATDVDSPTAAAVGGTININTLIPSDELGGLVSGSYGNIIAEGSGDRQFTRVFGMIQTGDFTGFGTKAWFSASTTRNTAAFANYGVVDKQQFNGKIYQEIGSAGDFIAISGHYNENRNNFGGSPLRASAFTGDKSGRFYNIAGGAPCSLDTPQAGVADLPNACGTDFERRYNPSNTGNIRLQSKFSLMDGLTLTVDGGFQYVKANGGGTTSAREQSFLSGGTLYTGFFGGTAYFGRDLNGDGDTLDRVTTLQPSQTNTRRYNAIVNLAYDFDENNRVRISYTYDRARHRQTGYTIGLFSNGEPMDVFAINDPLADAAGNELQKRNRLSYATLNQVSGEYRGRFFDEKLLVQIGLRAPFFKRDLTNYCYTSAANATGGFVDCIAGGNVTGYQNTNPYVTNTTTGRTTGSRPPFSRELSYDKLLPNLGATYRLADALSIAVSYAANISVPSTDALYNASYNPDNISTSKPVAETSDSYDLSLRYTTRKVQAAVTGWYSAYENRLVGAFDIDCSCSVDTNLGKVKKYGVDASFSYAPIPDLLFYAFGSYIKSEIQDDVVTGGCTLAQSNAGICYGSTATGFFYNTSGNRERGSPEWLYGARIQGKLGPVELGAQVKRTSSRFLNDLNATDNLFGAKFKGYTVVDIDLRYSLVSMGLKKTYFQLNVSNLFDQFYVGSFSGGLDTVPTSTNAFVNFGSPRAISGSIIVGF